MSIMSEQIQQDLISLPEEMQREAWDFIQFLKSKTGLLYNKLEFQRLA